MNSLKEKLKAGRRAVGTHISLGSFVLADAYAQMGYDYIWIDTEHTAVDYEELLRCVTIVRARGCAAVVRAHVEEPGHVKRILEMGVDGIVFPNLETAAQVDEAIRSTFYPPRGFRGFGPLGAVRYGLDSADDYIRREDELCRFVQIERKEAVDALDDILKVEGIDAFIIGPCDLSGSIGRLNRIYDEENLALIRETVRKAEAAGIPVGISVGTLDETEQRFWMELGCRLISAGADFDFAVRGALENSRQMRALRDELDKAEGK